MFSFSSKVLFTREREFKQEPEQDQAGGQRKKKHPRRPNQMAKAQSVLVFSSCKQTLTRSILVTEIPKAMGNAMLSK